MGAILSPPELDRLRKLCGLLGSDHDGEVVAAARKVTLFLQQRKMTWADAVAPIIVAKPTSDPAPRQEQQRSYTDSKPREWCTVTAIATRHQHLLTPWEAGFIAGLPRFTTLSAKQKSTLDNIADKLRRIGVDI